MIDATLPVSVLILTKNEQQDLPDCLKSVSWCDDVHVYDSGSTDNTLDIARQFGAHVTQRTYANTTAAFGGDEASHKNWGMRNIPFKHGWVLTLDADERTTPELLQAMREHCTADNPAAGLRIYRHDHFMGTWIKHVTPTPYQVRLMRPSAVHYERIINPITVIDGPIVDIGGHFNHFPFSKGLSHWFTKHNGYSTLEATLIHQGDNSKKVFKLGKALFSPDVNERRLHQKGLYYKMPFRPLIMFLGLYVGKRGFLDGHAGLAYATLRAIYEYMIVLKEKELRLLAQQQSV